MTGHRVRPQSPLDGGHLQTAGGEQVPRRKGRFVPGRSGNSAGRPKGSPNRATVEAKQVCAELIDDPEYRSKLKKRLLAGTLPPVLECLIWHYAKGKPKDEANVQGSLVVRWQDGEAEA
jgi:hypothetical protein